MILPDSVVTTSQVESKAAQVAVLEVQEDAIHEAANHARELSQNLILRSSTYVVLLALLQEDVV